MFTISLFNYPAGEILEFGNWIGGFWHLSFGPRDALKVVNKKLPVVVAVVGNLKIITTIYLARLYKDVQTLSIL